MSDILISDGSTTVALPGDGEWRDERQWSDYVGAARYSLGGRLVVQESRRLSGRPLTLVFDPSYVRLGSVDALRALDTPGSVLSVTLADGRVLSPARWRRHDGEPIEADPVRYVAPLPVTAWCRLTLRLFLE